MLEIKKFTSLEELEKQVKTLKDNDYYFLGEFLREVDSENDELMILLALNEKEILLTCTHPNTELLPKISDIYYAANLFENEIYDFYGKPTKGSKNYCLRLHTYDKNYFPKRKLGKAIVKEKQEYVFTDIKAEGSVKVQVGPIHAGIIPPGHFRFTVDGEDILNLDIQLGWKHKGVENYFQTEKDLSKLLNASEEIAGDSKIATSLSFAKIIEKSANLKVSKTTKLNRIIALELERIYNHIWTIGALMNDVGQGYLLNGFLEIREEFLNLNEKVFGNRLLAQVIDFGKNKKYLDKEKSNLVLETIQKIYPRFENLLKICLSSTGIYDRLSTTGIVKKQTAETHSALGVGAKASGIKQDYREFDKYYQELDLVPEIILGENGDCFDRFKVRAEEIKISFEIIKNAIKILEKEGYQEKEKNQKIQLTDGYFVGRTEGHRGENMQLIYVENGEIKYYKFKDPSFVNWTLLEYAVLNNIIADFPICNKSFDLSYSGFDV